MSRVLKERLAGWAALALVAAVAAAWVWALFHAGFNVG